MVIQSHRSGQEEKAGQWGGGKSCAGRLNKHSTATNKQLSAVVRGKVAARTVSDYLARADPPCTTKVIQDQEPEELSEEWRAGARRWLEGVKKIRVEQTESMKTRDSSRLRTKLRHEGEHGRGTPILRARSRYATKYTLHVYAKR